MWIWMLIPLVLAPTLFCLVFVYSKDRWEPEPKTLVMKVFFTGFAVAIPTVLVQWGLLYIIGSLTEEPNWVILYLTAFFVFAAISEMAKYLVFKILIGSSEEFNEKLDGIVYMVAAATGFAAVENFGYGLLLELYWQPIYRSILSAFFHAICSGILGAYLGEAEFTDSDWKAFFFILTGFFAATFIHSLYEFFLLYPRPWAPWMNLPLLLFSGTWLLWKMQRLTQESPFRELQKT